MIRPSPPALRTWLAALALPLTLACASSTSKSDEPQDREFTVKAWSPDLLENRNTTGVYLAELDVSIKTWNSLLLTAQSAEDRRKLVLLQEDIGYRANRRFEQILEQLETGPPANRQVAALAIGFSGAPAALSPLLAALEDPEPQVVSNALMGIAVLGDPVTPLVGVAQHMNDSLFPFNRNNASWAVLQVLRAGGEGGEIVREAAHKGLRDEEPSVRTNSALILAHLRDEEALDTLKLQLYDEVNICACAAARALAYIGDGDDRLKGECARALASCLEKVNPTVREAVLRDLMRLSDRNYGRDTESWVTWAHRLP